MAKANTANRVAETSANELLDVVRDLEPLIREHAAEGERQRRSPAPLARALVDAGMFRLFRPRERGGFEADPSTAYRVIAELSRIDSATGWNVGISNASEAFGGYFDDAVTDEVFGPHDAVVAGAFNPHRRALAVDGGYRLSGSTSFNSNCHTATWFIGLADIYDGDELRTDGEGNSVTLLTVVPAQECCIVDNWNTMGMCGTGSHDVAVEDVFVPNERAVTFGPLDRPSRAYEGPMSRMVSFSAATCNAVPALGIARAAIDDLVELGRKVPAYTQRALRDRGDVQTNIAIAEGKLSAAESYLYSVYDEAWRRVCGGEYLDMPQKARCQLAASHAVAASAEAVDLVHACVGANGIRNEYAFQKYFRDVHVVTQHAFVCASRFGAVGQVMLGLEPDWPFFYS
jgi:alkylation response protein AidB-like acyl-CoA dehydrogenase